MLAGWPVYRDEPRQSIETSRLPTETTMSHKLCVARSTCSLFLLALFQGCSSNNNDQQAIEAQSSAKRVTDPQVSASDATTFASDNEAFALNAYQVMAAQAGNLVFSPTSISLALAMAYAGAAWRHGQ